MAPPKDEKGPGVPPHMVSFADMMTILLCFFVLLCAFSQVRQNGMVAAGITSFRAAIKNKGMPGILTGQRSKIKLNDRKVRFEAPQVVPTNPDDWEPPPEERPDNQMDALSTDSLDKFEEKNNFVIANLIQFDRGSSKLPNDADEKLKTVLQTVITHTGIVEISGHCASNEVSGEEIYQLSLERALAVLRLIEKVTKMGPSQLRPVGWGDGKPSSSEGDRPEDRRVSLHLIQN